MNRPRSPGYLSLVAALFCGCAWFRGEDVPVEPLRNLAVVDERAAFDPSLAVDDDDEREPAWPAATSDDAPSTADELPPPTRSDGLPADEHLLQPEDVRRLVEMRRQSLERRIDAGVDDSTAKVAVARNPVPEEIGPAKPVTWTLLDLGLEGVLVAAGALLLTAIHLLVARFPKATIASLVVAGVAVGLFVTVQWD